MNNRRKFLKLGAVMASGAFLPFQFCSSPEGKSALVNNNAGRGLSNIGIQLYSVKDQMDEDVRNTLEKIAAYGYDTIEGYDGGKGIFWGMQHRAFKDMTSDLGLKFISTHANVFEGLEQKASEAAEIDLKYLICPYVGPQESMDDFKRLADEFNRIGQVCKDKGIRFAYHNHGYTFEPLEGEMPQDFLMENTDPELVYYEMDFYWVVVPGHDPEAYLRKYSDRFKLGHIKDRRKDASPGEADASTELGTGMIDFLPIIKTAKENGMDYFFAEQERFDNITSMESAEKNAQYLKNVKVS
ncbi:sugar phosphate isomerase/epimerase family protein [Anditalea andensis]|uniref:Sugar phosphate isomerase n=1 Tax=Anditalea andensis TaxID=1048983 RepID=A0A074KUN8_9BACT|nr:sugar phosphate isomerase/epimerase [Anditalea andensis]KEO73681.1 sugar phosphate isomerase [Anditalea andensis]